MSDAKKVARRMYCGAASRRSAEGTILAWDSLPEEQKSEWLARGHDALAAVRPDEWNAAIEAAVKWAEADRELAIDGLTDHVCAHLRSFRRPAGEEG